MSFYHKHILKGVFITLSLIAFSCKSDQTSETTEQENKLQSTILVHAKAEPDRLNPMLTVNSYAGRTVKYIFSPLLTYDPESIELVPVLAKALPEVSTQQDGPNAGMPAYTYEIKEEATWDDGSPVVASDYVFTLKAMFNPAVASEIYRSILGFIVDVEIDEANPRKFTVYTNQSNMNGMYYAGWYVYPEHIYDPEGLLKDVSLNELTDSEKAAALMESNPNLKTFGEAFNDSKFAREKGFVSGSGPYTFEGWTTGQQLELVKKEDWWGSKFEGENNLFKADPYKITYKFIPDDNTAVASLKDEEIDIMGAIPETQFQDLEKNEDFLKKYNLFRVPTLSTGYIGLNNESPKLEDKRVRQALAYTIDVDEIIDVIKDGAAKKCVGPINPNLPYFNKSLEQYNKNTEKARALLKEAGWEDTNNNGIVDKEIDGEVTDLNIEFLVPVQSNIMVDIAEMVKEYGKEAGIEFTVNKIDFNIMMSKNVAQGDFEAYILSGSADVSLFNPYQYFHSASKGNYARYKSEEADAIIDKIIKTTDDNERLRLYMEFQEMINEEQPWLYLYSPVQGLAVHKRFGNVIPTVHRPGYYEANFELSENYTTPR